MMNVKARCCRSETRRQISASARRRRW